MAIKRVCVYAASSRQCDPEYHDAAARLGRQLARNQVTLVYGGGSVGSMGHLADAALAEGGRVIGVLPRFMYDLEWGHRGLLLRVCPHAPGADSPRRYARRAEIGRAHV